MACSPSGGDGPVRRAVVPICVAARRARRATRSRRRCATCAWSSGATARAPARASRWSRGSCPCRSPSPARPHRWRRAGRRPCGAPSPGRGRASRSRRRTRRARAGPWRPRPPRAAWATRGGLGQDVLGGLQLQGSPPPRSSLRVRGCLGRKSATAAAMNRASAPGRAARTASRIRAVVGASTRSPRRAPGRTSCPAMSVTRAPRARAASAIATPIRPVQRLPMKRTGSIGSAVPPGGDHDVPAVEVLRPGRNPRRRRPRRGRGRAPHGPARDGRRRPRPRSRRRPPAGRGPPAPDASGPTPGLHDRVPEATRSRSTFARVAGCAYISPSIAGATTTGAAEARQVAVMTSSARPPAMAPSQRAVAGATRIASACPRPRCGRCAGRAAAPAGRASPAAG